MRLIRGWEAKYAPDVTGGLRLSKASTYRALGEEDGLGDKREGEIRFSAEGVATLTWQQDMDAPVYLTEDMEEFSDAAVALQMREWLAAELDDPDIELEKKAPGKWRILQTVKVADTDLDSPFLFCLAREPVTKPDWERLQAALPVRYDTWTVTEDVASLKFEIECGLKRWMGLNEITEHKITRGSGWVAYSLSDAPPAANVEELDSITRWFRKRKEYSDQEEYRIALDLRTPQWKRLPDAIEIELTKTGLGLFKPWSPPER